MAQTATHRPLPLRQAAPLTLRWVLGLALVAITLGALATLPPSRRPHQGRSM